MKTKKIAKNILLGGLMTVGVAGAIQKMSDSTHRDIYNTLQKTNTTDDIKKYSLPDTLDLTSPQLSKLLHKDNSSLQSQREHYTLKDYMNYSFPLPNYETPPEFYTHMVQERIRTSLHPGQHFPTGIEDYPLEVIRAQGTAALCATGTISQLKTTNTRSNTMWKFFGKTGKDTWKLEQLLSQHGRESIIDTKDQSAYYQHRKVSGHNLPTHYDNLLQHADKLSANTLLTARYADSRKLHDATSTNKNATHSLRSLGQISQDLSFEQLGLTGNNLQVFQKEKDDNEKKVILIWHLLYQRQIQPGMCKDFATQSPRIRQLLHDYPQLLTVTRDDTNAQFHGTMVDHVYPIGQAPTNFVHYLFELIAYKGSNKDGSKFLICDIMKPGPQALKYDSYNAQSPLYTQIQDIRQPLMEKDFIGSTYIVNFDDIDLNGNKKIDKTDKPIHEVLDDIVTTWYTNHGQKKGLTKEETKSYIKKYLTILGAMDRFPTGTILPLPLLTLENRTHIDTSYDNYTEVFNTFRDSSKETYFSHLEHDNVPQLTTTNISTKGSFIYPVCFGDDNMSITQQICIWIDLLAQHNHNIHPGVNLGSLTREEYNIIHTIIAPYIHYKDTKNIQPGQTITIDIAGILASSDFQAYITEQKKLTTNYLPSVDYAVLGRFDDLMKKLNIDESNRTIVQQYILRETGGEIGFFDIAKTRSWSKMVAEGLGFDDTLSSIKEVSSQGALQMRIKYFVKGDNNQIGWIIQSAKDLLDNKKLNLSEQQHKQLQHIIEIAQPLLIQKNRQRALHDKIKDYKINTKENEYENFLSQQHINNEKIQQGENEILHALSDIINFTSSSLTDPEQDLGTLLSIKMTSYQLNKYKSEYARQLRKHLNTGSLSVEQVAFIQEFSYIANHAGTPLNQQYRNEIVQFYDKKKQQNPNYTFTELHNEQQLQHIYNYVNTLPSHNDFASASIWNIMILLSAIGFYSTNRKR